MKSYDLTKYLDTLFSFAFALIFVSYVFFDYELSKFSVGAIILFLALDRAERATNGFTKKED